MAAKSRARLTDADLLPGRPPKGPDAGPDADPDDPARALYPTRAICCSGGGVRAAAFALGGIQFLNEQPDGPGQTFYSNTHLVTSVSGGGYAAGSYASVAHRLPAGAEPRVFAPGSPEDVRLRAHTKYLIDSKTQLSISLLGILYGLLMNLLAILAAAYIVAKVVGVLLGPHVLHALRLSSDGVNWQTYFPPALLWALFGVFLAGVFIYLTYRLIDTYRPVGESATKLWCVAAIYLMAASALATVLLVGLPWVLSIISQTPGKVMQVHAGPQTATLVSTILALVAIVARLVRTYTPKRDPNNPLTTGLTRSLTSVWNRISSAVLPWLGSVILVVLLAVAMLTWVSNMAYGRNEAAQLWAVLGCGLFLLGWQALTDGNRTSLHRYYTQRPGHRLRGDPFGRGAGAAVLALWCGWPAAGDLRRGQHRPARRGAEQPQLCPVHVQSAPNGNLERHDVSQRDARAVQPAGAGVRRRRSSRMGPGLPRAGASSSGAAASRRRAVNGHGDVREARQRVDAD